MHDELSVVAFDGDEAVAEAVAGLDEAGQTRGAMFRRAGAAAGGLGVAMALLGGSGVAGARQGGSKKNDVKILNFALTLEYLESAFYASALKHAGLTGEHKRLARTVHAHEAAHVQALKKALGSAAVKRPTFDFGSAVTSQSAFTATAIVLEDTGVQAYQGQTPYIQSNAVFKAAISIHPVEARHAAWIRNIGGQAPAPDAFNPALTKDQVLAAVTGTGFIK